MQARRAGAETFRAAPSGRRILAADGCASTSSGPAYCFCAFWGPGGPREWRSSCSDTLVWACSSEKRASPPPSVALAVLDYPFFSLIRGCSTFRDKQILRGQPTFYRYLTARARV